MAEMTFTPATEAEVQRIIMSGNSKYCQLDPIPTNLLKQCLDCLLPIITQMVTQSIASCLVPTAWKSATVTPLLKKPNTDPEDMNNYRPISNLPYISKITENMVVARLQAYMHDNALNPVHQSAYRKHHSTETALLKISNDILCDIDNNRCSLVVMLDQSAAFDTVNLDILLERLEHSYGITGTALSWLKSYYTGRSQSVSISGTSSATVGLGTGFPQGSVLGPFQYPTYTAPLFEFGKKHDISMHMYADDTQLYISFLPHESRTALSKMQLCITEIQQWMSVNHLKLNTAKTEVLLIGSTNMLSKINDLTSVPIGDDTVVISKSARNIGAVLDRNLSLVEHVNILCRACYLKLRQISQIRQYLSEDAAATLVRCLITSKLDYVNGLLYGLPDNLLHKLQLIQNNAVRLVMRKRKRDHVTPLLMQLHWLPIRQRITYKINVMTYKAINNLAPKYIKDLLTIYEPRRTLRSASQGLLVERSSNKKRTGDRAFAVCAPKLWNKLPLNVRACTSLDTFKTSLKTFLFQQAYA